MLDLQRGADPVERVTTGGGAFTKAKKPVGELFSIIGQNRAGAQRAGPFQVAQETPGVDGGFGVKNAYEHPTRGPVDGHEKVTA